MRRDPRPAPDPPRDGTGSGPRRPPSPRGARGPAGGGAARGGVGCPQHPRPPGPPRGSVPSAPPLASASGSGRGPPGGLSADGRPGPAAPVRGGPAAPGGRGLRASIRAPTGHPRGTHGPSPQGLSRPRPRAAPWPGGGRRRPGRETPGRRRQRTFLREDLSSGDACGARGRAINSAACSASSAPRRRAAGVGPELRSRRVRDGRALPAEPLLVLLGSRPAGVRTQFRIWGAPPGLTAHRLTARTPTVPRPRRALFYLKI